MLPMPAEEAVPEWEQELLCWVIALHVKQSPAWGGTEKEGSHTSQVGLLYLNLLHSFNSSLRPFPRAEFLPLIKQHLL